MSRLTIVDLFAGAGGESTGIMQAVRKFGLDVDLIAVNHWETAINTHSLNHPSATHYCEPIDKVDPRAAVPGGHVDILWASPECTHHSNARGGKPRDDQSRASVRMIMAWLEKLDVKRVFIENVREFLTWGPLDRHQKPIKSRKGEFFRAFVKELHALGYAVEWRILCAADYGTPTIRKRLFIQAVKGGPCVWPEPTHAQTPDLVAREAWIPARDIIDWSIPSPSIFARKRPLAPATLRRIEAGIKRFWGEWAEPFLVLLRGTGTVRDVAQALPAVTAGGNHIALVEPFIYTSGHRSSVRVAPLDAPLSTVVTKAEHCLVVPYYGNSQAQTAETPLGTVTCRDRFAMVVPYYGQSNAQPVSAPLGAVSCQNHYALVDGHVIGLDIGFRMLHPHELAAAQGFPGGYRFAGGKSDKVRQIGNAVPPPVVEALVTAVLEYEGYRMAA